MCTPCVPGRNVQPPRPPFPQAAGHLTILFQFQLLVGIVAFFADA